MICHISNAKIDSYASQLIIFISIILVAIYAHQIWFLYLVLFDYCIRTFFSDHGILLRFIGISLGNLIKWRQKMIDKVPSVFYSRQGFLCLLSSFILFHTNLPTASFAIVTIVMSLFLLDAFGIVGFRRVIDHHIVFPFITNRV